MTTLATPERRATAFDDRGTPPLSTLRSTQNISSPSTRQQSTPHLTVEAVMSSANGNAVVALENVLAERNMLSSQNTQLWKLIEKQRAVHGNAMKELERIRAERDRALAKLDPERAHIKTTTHRSSSTSTTGLNASTRVAESPSPGSERQNGHRYPMIRHQSDDASLSSPRASTASFPALSASRSHEPLRPPEQQPSPLSESSVIDTLTEPVTNGMSHPSEPPSAAPAALSTLPTRTKSFPLPDSSVVVSTSGSTQPLQIGKLQPQQSLPTAVQVLTVVNQSPPDTTVTPSDLATDPPTEPPIVRHSSLPLSGSQGVVSPTPGLSVPAIQNRQLARESRITLPDEARRYIANMQESPLPSPSPRHAAFTTSALNGCIVEEPASIEIEDSNTQNLGESDANSGFVGPGLSSQESSGQRSTQSFDAPPNVQSDVPSAFLDLREDDDELDSTETPSDEPNTPMPPFSLMDTTFGIRSSPSDTQQEFPLIPTDPSVAPQAAYPETVTFRPQPSLVTQESDPTTSRDVVHSDPHMDTRSLNVPASPIAAGPSRLTPPPITGGASPVMIKAQAPSFTTTQAQVQAQRMAYAQAHTHENNQPPRGQLQPQPQNAGPVYSNPNARARLAESDLPRCRVSVVGSNIRANERGKEVLSFVVQVTPSGSPDAADSWKVEKLYSEVLSLDARIRSKLRRSDLKKLGNLPDNKLFKDHAPAKVDQRKAVLENYLQTVVKAPLRDSRDACEFFTTDVMNEASAPVTQSGYKEGYLTKRGKNFGGWKTRYFVLQGPVLEYYESRGGTHLGSINITGAQIGRQQKSTSTGSSDDENEYRHAFLIIESKKGASSQHTRHVLCAESDAERDSWVDVLVRYVMGSYDDTGISATTSASATNTAPPSYQPRPSTSSITSIETSSPKRMTRVDIAKGSAVPISQRSHDQINAKLFQSAPIPDSSSSTTSSPLERYPPPVDRSLQAITEVPLSSSLPTHLDVAGGGGLLSQRAASELGHYPDMTPVRNPAPTYHDTRGQGGQRPDRVQVRSSVHPSLSTVQSSPTFPTPNGSTDRAPSPEPSSLMPPDGSSKVKISGPINGTPIPAGYKFGAKDTPSDQSNSERERKAKSRNFWGFGRVDKAQAAGAVGGAPPRAVFAISISDSLMVAQIANLPAVVFRCIQYLEAKKADQEEGIYRLSGSSAVIKSLRDRFNAEGDFDLLASDEFWDPHAIAGLLKSFLRELPTSILTRDLHLRFLAVIDLTDTQERVSELAQLISQLPLPNYSLLRALTAHLILIVQNASVNKMTMRNVGIVFSPTLGIPAGVFSLMLSEFNRVFNVEGDASDANAPASTESEPNAQLSNPLSTQNNRNSRSYTDGAADKMLGLMGRSLKPPGEDSDSADDVTIPDSASGTETDPDATATYNKSTSDLANGSPVSERRERANSASQADTPPRQKAAAMAAMRGLQISTDRRRSGASGLPHSPRPAGKSTPPYAPSMSGSAPNTPH